MPEPASRTLPVAGKSIRKVTAGYTHRAADSPGNSALGYYLVFRPRFSAYGEMPPGEVRG
jgi:hypothetical protein